MRRVRYVESGGLSIAYETVSDGPPDVVFISGFVDHRDLEWEFAMGRRNNERVMAMGRLIMFDKRGTGLSDRDLGFGTLEDRMDDIRAVMDAADSQRASFITVGEGGPLAMMFAATYPERVDRLVLYSSYCCGRRRTGYPWGATEEQAGQLAVLAERNWGSGRVMATLYGTDDEHLIEFFARFERSSASPGMVRRIMEANREIDARAILPAITVPTLVIHYLGDPYQDVEASRWMAEQIPGARFLEVPGNWNADDINADADVWDVIHEFITGEQRRAETDRILATVLFTDIVGSTEQAAELGDAAWTSLLDRRTRRRLRRRRA